MLFLSYAEEDKETAGQIAQWLRRKGYTVFRWEDPERRGRRFIKQISGAIIGSEAFLALLSPSFLGSDWCERETEVALQREQVLQAGDPDRRFVHVLKIVDTPSSDAGFLGSYDSLDLNDPESREAELGKLADRLGPPGEPGDGASREAGAGPGGSHCEMVNADQAAPKFRNREDELEKVLRGITNASGPHFWLVIAPPQLGKTWFLRRVSEYAELADPADSAGWVTRQVDLQEQPAEMRGDAAAVLALLFGLEPQAAIEPGTLRRIAQAITKSGRPHLCMLDSAELLDRQAAAALRSCLGQVYNLVRGNGHLGVRLALIVSSRREDEWRGVAPAPRLSQLPLTEFRVDVVEEALRDLAREMRRTFPDAAYTQNASRVRRLTEGLPALLVRCLEWIQAEEWFEMERLETQELFDELTDPYVLEELLAEDSLFPGSQAQGDERLQVLAEAFRVLAPYRFFTVSHLRQFEADNVFSGWSLEHLWKAISGTALLLQPLDEPWQEIHAAIRRLLHRHYYKSQEHQAEAHSEARKFVETWAAQQSGKEQVIGLVESLWHEATVERLRHPEEMTQRLSESARTLSRALQPSPAYTLDELRSYASERMRNDEELEEAVSRVDGLFNRLVEIVVTPL